MGLEVVDQLMSARFKIRKKGTVELDHRQTEWYKDRRFRAWVSLIQRADLSDDLQSCVLAWVEFPDSLSGIR